jgi:hypothetical protein
MNKLETTKQVDIFMIFNFLKNKYLIFLNPFERTIEIKDLYNEQFNKTINI